MRAVNPAYIPRNHLVEAALKAAVGRRDFGPFEGCCFEFRPFDGGAICRSPGRCHGR